MNCGAIPEGTIDSELFGHEKGSFTGATADRKGYFEVADGGTIFLDEVGELPLSTQVRLLRVLEAGEFIKVGSSKTQKTDVRVVAATNINIMQAIRDGRFREDLFYRLNTVPIFIPPLRERREDIPLLFRKFAADFAEKYSMPPVRLSEDARQILMNYYWNGNVRQLKNITEQISVIEQQREINASTLRMYLPNENTEKLPAIIGGSKSENKTFNNEREILYQVLFDMKKDISDLKKVVNELSSAQIQTDVSYSPTILQGDNYVNQMNHPTEKSVKFNDVDDVEPIQEIEDYKEEDEKVSLEDMERELIRKSLEKHKGKRKIVARELKISERTLYRKIKDYEIEI